MSARVFPVVHHQDSDLSLVEAKLALALGADGVFLISHGGADEDLISLARTLTYAYPDRLIGVNFLGMSATEAVAVCIEEGFKALWVDDSGMTSAGVTDAGVALAHDASCGGISLFASVAFKYQRAEQNAPAAGLKAASLGAIPTTSGSGTGQAPDVGKIKSMYEAMATPARLAIASGMTVENIAEFLPWATDFLVATGVSQDVHHFDEARLKSFIEKVHARV